jgi:transketolase
MAAAPAASTTQMSVMRKAAELGKLAVRMTSSAGSGHPSSALSLAHIIAELMYRQMRIDPSNPWSPTADRLVLSEGHAVPIVYAAWADLGGVIGKSPNDARKLTVADVDTLRELNSELDGHPNPAEGFPFFDAATGSLGMGLSVAAGLAAAARLENSPRRVFCIIGDGESREGQIWEAADFIVDQKLTNVCAIFNANGQGQADHVSVQQTADRLHAKLQAFGWESVIIDGHNPEELEQAFAKMGKTAAPLAIVARTIKGWGVPELLNGNWHGKPLPMKDVASAEAALDAKWSESRTAGPDVSRPSAPVNAPLVSRVDPAKAQWPDFNTAMEEAGFGGAVKKNLLATRKAYGAALLAAGKVLPQVVTLDADVSNSTFSELFAKSHKDRFFECKIAEQNMVSAAVGFAAGGCIPFVNTFSKFFARGYDQVELAAIGRANIKLVGSHSGISLAADGPSQMSVADVAFFHAYASVRGDDRKTPVCWLLQPSDAVAAYELTRQMTITRAMCYMRTFRPETAILHAPGTKFELGGFHTFGTGTDLAIVAAGYMVHVALEAQKMLEQQNIRATVVDAYCLPLDGARLLETLERAGGRALVCEDNYGGGLGAAVAVLAAKHGKIRVQAQTVSRLPKSARTAEEILTYCGVGAQQVADQALALKNAR